MHRQAKPMTLALTAMLVAFAAGCPGTLDDKERFEQGASSTASSTIASTSATGSGGAGGAASGTGGTGGTGG